MNGSLYPYVVSTLAFLLSLYTAVRSYWTSRTGLKVHGMKLYTYDSRKDSIRCYIEAIIENKSFIPVSIISVAFVDTEGREFQCHLQSRILFYTCVNAVGNGKTTTLFPINIAGLHAANATLLFDLPHNTRQSLKFREVQSLGDAFSYVHDHDYNPTPAIRDTTKLWSGKLHFHTTRGRVDLDVLAEMGDVRDTLFEIKFENQLKKGVS